MLGDNAIYYGSPDDVKKLLNEIDTHASKHKELFIKNNLDVIRKEYSWEKLVDEHEKYFQWMLEQKR